MEKDRIENLTLNFEGRAHQTVSPLNIGSRDVQHLLEYKALRSFIVVSKPKAACELSDLTILVELGSGNR